MSEQSTELLCPKCQTQRNKVINSRAKPDYVRRRRECAYCGFRFTTEERISTYDEVLDRLETYVARTPIARRPRGHREPRMEANA